MREKYRQTWTGRDRVRQRGIWEEKECKSFDSIIITLWNMPGGAARLDGSPHFLSPVILGAGRGGGEVFPSTVLYIWIWAGKQSKNKLTESKRQGLILSHYFLSAIVANDWQNNRTSPVNSCVIPEVTVWSLCQKSMRLVGGKDRKTHRRQNVVL